MICVEFFGVDTYDSIKSLICTFGYWYNFLNILSFIDVYEKILFYILVKCRLIFVMSELGFYEDVIFF